MYSMKQFKMSIAQNVVFWNTNLNTVSVMYLINNKLSQNFEYLLSSWNIILNKKDVYVTIYSQLFNS